jgi:methionyl-tRNA formyltransferase
MRMTSYPEHDNARIRTAVFGSYYRGYYVLDELLSGPLSAHVTVVGVATDNPANTFISRAKRVWQYPHTETEANLVRDRAQRQGLPVFDGRVKGEDFRNIFRTQWRPDLCVTATFGQRIDDYLFSTPPLGFLNLHPYDGGSWPSPYAGPNPFEAMLRDGRDDCSIALHRVDEGFDTGALIAKTDPISIPRGACVTDLHKITSPIAARLVRDEILRLLGERRATRAGA